MNIGRLQKKPTLLIAIICLSLGLFLVRLGSYLSLEISLYQKENALRKITGLGNLIPGKLSTTAREQSLQGLLGDDAKAAGVKRLLNIDSASKSNRDLVQLEWEASISSTLKFLKRLQDQGHLGFCERLRVSTADNALLHVGGSFERGSFVRGSGISSSSSTKTVQLMAQRNVFVPLWEYKREDPILVEAKESQKKEELHKQEQEKLAEEQKRREEESRLETKKRDMETNLILTGIVNNGHEPLALINTQSNGGQTLMLHAGDVIQDAKITTIDEHRGEIQLDYLGKFKLNLKIGARAGGVTQ